MSEKTSGDKAETTLQVLRELLNDPKIRTMLTCHYREYVALGIISAYSRDLVGQYQPPNDKTRNLFAVIMGPDGLKRRNASRLRDLRGAQDSLGAETFFLVGLYPASYDESSEESEASDYETYFLDKIDPSTGEPIALSSLNVCSVRDRGPGLWPEVVVDAPSFNSVQAELIRRHYDEQVEAGIVYKGQFPVILY